MRQDARKPPSVVGIAAAASATGPRRQRDLQLAVKAEADRSRVYHEGDLAPRRPRSSLRLLPPPNADVVGPNEGQPPVLARTGSVPELGHADLVACLEILRSLGIAFSASDQSDRAMHLHRASEVLRDLIDGLETSVHPRLARLIGPSAERRTWGGGRLTNDEHSSVSRPRLPDRRARSTLDQIGARRTRVRSLPRPQLSPREREVLALLVEGYSNAAIAAALSIARRTAETHVAHILGKLDVSSRTAAIAYAVRHGLIE